MYRNLLINFWKYVKKVFEQIITKFQIIETGTSISHSDIETTRLKFQNNNILS